jgi:hypothetical protein
VGIVSDGPRRSHIDWRVATSTPHPPTHPEGCLAGAPSGHLRPASQARIVSDGRSHTDWRMAALTGEYTHSHAARKQLQASLCVKRSSH